MTLIRQNVSQFWPNPATSIFHSIIHSCVHPHQHKVKGLYFLLRAMEWCCICTANDNRVSSTVHEVSFLALSLCRVYLATIVTTVFDQQAAECAEGNSKLGSLLWHPVSAQRGFPAFRITTNIPQRLRRIPGKFDKVFTKSSAKDAIRSCFSVVSVQ